MINCRYRLIKPKCVDTCFIEEELGDKVIIRPKYLAICAADERYYFGKRELTVLQKKLPMSLIHEAVGEVLYDAKGYFKKNQKVVLIPNTPSENSKIIKSNYLVSSRFRSSGYDGFMQSVVFMSKECVIKLPEDADLQLYCLLEIISICVNAMKRFEQVSHPKKDIIGIWGSGSVGYVMVLLLKITYKDSKIVVFGRNPLKLEKFSFADERYLIDNIPENIKIDHSFECVGGIESEAAINQIISLINPMGSIALLGVSENKIDINTRDVLSKGLTIYGNSRSDINDFKYAINLLNTNTKFAQYMRNIISDTVTIKNINDINKAFEININNDFKTVMKWEI